MPAPPAEPAEEAISFGALEHYSLGSFFEARDRLREAIAQAQARGQLDPGDGAGLLVLHPAGARQEPAGHALDREHAQRPHQHRPPLEQRRVGGQRLRVLLRVGEIGRAHV